MLCASSPENKQATAHTVPEDPNAFPGWHLIGSSHQLAEEGSLPGITTEMGLSAVRGWLTPSHTGVPHLVFS